MRPLRRPRRRPVRLASVSLLLLATCAYAALGEGRASADASAPPPFTSLPGACPGASNPGTAATPAAAGAAFTPYLVPFRAIIYDGDLKLPPDVDIPHLYATACGTVQLPQLTGRITASNIVLATPNIYVAGLEALPASVHFNGLQANIDLTPAHNGGLDVTINGTTTASVTTLGFTCGITLDAVLTTHTSGSLSGQPVTGPTQQGQAEVVSNTFPVPAVVGSDTGTCPPSIAQTFNKLLGLPAAPGVGAFVAPFCFDFELEHTNLPPSTKNCPWPSS